jgi:hypothetical protein
MEARNRLARVIAGAAMSGMTKDEIVRRPVAPLTLCAWTVDDPAAPTRGSATPLPRQVAPRSILAVSRLADPHWARRDRRTWADPPPHRRTIHRQRCLPEVPVRHRPPHQGQLGPLSNAPVLTNSSPLACAEAVGAAMAVSVNSSPQGAFLPFWSMVWGEPAVPAH